MKKLKLLLTDSKNNMIYHNSILSNIEEYGSLYPIVFENGSFGMIGK